jgi:hypothetical protein
MSFGNTRCRQPMQRVVLSFRTRRPLAGEESAFRPIMWAAGTLHKLLNVEKDFSQRNEPKESF